MRDERIRELVIIANKNRRINRRVNEHQLNLAYTMIKEGYKLKAIMNAYPNVTQHLYNELFKLITLMQREGKRTYIMQSKQPYWQTEDEMIIPNYTFEGLSIVEQEIYKAL